MASVTVTHSTPADGTRETQAPKEVVEARLPPPKYVPLVTPTALMQSEQIVEEIRILMKKKMDDDEDMAIILIVSQL